MQDLKNEIINACHKMCSKQLTVGTWGNISCRDPQTGLIYITPSGMEYETLTPDDIIVLDNEAKIVEGERKPTIEHTLHWKIYQARADVNTIIHTHPVHSTVFSVTETELPAITESFAQIVGAKIICAEYALPGTEALAEHTVKALGDVNAVLLTNHGTVCVGPSIDFAFKVCDVVEETAQIFILSKLLGQPRVLPDADIKAMQEFVQTKYGQQ